MEEKVKEKEEGEGVELAEDSSGTKQDVDARSGDKEAIQGWERMPGEIREGWKRPEED